MFKCLNVKMAKKGLTLLEVIIAIFLITVGVLGALALITRTISVIGISTQKAIASYLAQEGIEVIRNIRDTNWLEYKTDITNPWNEGLTGCSGGCIADYTHSEELDPNLPAYTGQFLNIDTDSFYSYDTTSPFTPTKFKRKITITQPATADCPAGDCLNVSVLVEWQEKGKTYSVPAQENLYNWR